MIILDLINVILLVAFILHFTFGILVYVRDARSRVNQAYALFLLAIMTWTLAIIFFRSANEQLYFWQKAISLAGTFLASTFLYFTTVFPFRAGVPSRRWGLIAFVPNVILIGLILLTDKIVGGAIAPSGDPYTIPLFDIPILRDKETVFGSWYPVYAGYFVASFGLAFVWLVRTYHQTIGHPRRQVGAVILGFLAATIVSFITTLFFPWFGIIRLGWLGPVISLIIVTVITAVIVKRELANMKILATEFLVGLVVVIFVIDVVMARTINEFIIRFITLLLIAFFGSLLITSVLNEVRRRELTEELTTTLRLANQRLHILDQAKSNFMSVASLRLRTPISALKGYFSMLLENDFGKLAKEQRAIVERNLISSDRLVRLINTFLDASKIEIGDTQFTRAPVDMLIIIKSVVSEFALAAKEKHLALTTNLPTKSLAVIGDETRLHEVVSNLVDNAIKYTPVGGRVTVSLRIEAKRVVVRVADTGMGIDPAEVGHLFRKFVRGSGVVRVDVAGSGLGLFIVKKIVAAHGGTVRVESAGEGKGATFVVEIPAIKK